MDYLVSLNEPQREAVLATQGPLMIIAGAGSGKTRVLTYRIAHLIRSGIAPYRILSLTFTNKAAKEMRNRIDKEVGSEAKDIWMGTFHSVFSKILRTEAEHIGYPRDFTIYDTDDTKSLLRDIISEMKLDDKLYKVNGVYARISGAKNRLISPAMYNQDPLLQADDTTALKPYIGKIYAKYVDRCIKAGAMDFDDLLFNTNVLFKNRVDILEKYQKKFEYIMVDEFQDTNISQYLITKKLSAYYGNICIVGDDAQSIYAFRGADIQNILNFEKDFKNLKIIKLEQNYRSTQNIVNSANGVILKNQAQLRKDVWTVNEEGEKIDLIRASTESEEARTVVSMIFEQRMNEHLRNADFAILYRTNSQSRVLEEALRRIGIPYRLIGGLSFYQRKEIKDLISYLRLIINPIDEQALKRVINYPKRGIGESSLDRLFAIANDSGKTIWEIVRNAKSYMPGRIGDAIQGFGEIIQAFQVKLPHEDAYQLASQVAKKSGILTELHDDKTVEGIARYQNLQELLNGIQEFVENPDNEDKSLSSFLSQVALMTDADDTKNKDADMVTLMTIHASKGLEFRNVFVVGLEEGLFPSAMSSNSKTEIEEERRLFYVAITRAEKRLAISFSLSRYQFGQIKNSEPSRFLSDIDPRYLNTDRKFLNKSSFASDEYSSIAKPILKRTNSEVSKTIQQRMPTRNTEQTSIMANFKPAETKDLKVGLKVAHLKFGKGEIKFLDYSGADKKARVDFEIGGEKTLLLSFAKLMIL